MESGNKNYSLIDREGCLRQKARMYRKILDKDYPQPETLSEDKSTSNNLDDLKNMIRRTNLEYDNIRPIFISVEIPKK
jgi:hypothetical protein